MLSKPQHGWTEIVVGDFVGRGSYIQDLPVMLLEMFLRTLRWNIPSEITINEEGSTFRLCAASATTLSIHHSAGETFSFDIDLRILAAELIADLRRDWQDWFVWSHEHDSEFSEKHRCDHLSRLIDTLKRCL